MTGPRVSDGGFRAAIRFKKDGQSLVFQSVSSKQQLKLKG